MYAHLFHSISVANGNGAVVESVEVYRYAIRRSDFVLTSVTFAYRAGGVVCYGEMFSEFLEYLLGLFGEVFLQGQNGLLKMIMK